MRTAGWVAHGPSTYIRVDGLTVEKQKATPGFPTPSQLVVGYPPAHGAGLSQGDIDALWAEFRDRSDPSAGPRAVERVNIKLLLRWPLRATLLSVVARVDPLVTRRPSRVAHSGAMVTSVERRLAALELALAELRHSLACR